MLAVSDEQYWPSFKQVLDLRSGPTKQEQPDQGILYCKEDTKVSPALNELSLKYLINQDWKRVIGLHQDRIVNNQSKVYIALVTPWVVVCK